MPSPPADTTQAREAEQITCDWCGVPLFVTTCCLVDERGSKVCATGDNWHDSGGIMASASKIGATYAEARRGQSNRLIYLPGTAFDA
jgi:hypothetical protein